MTSQFMQQINKIHDAIESADYDIALYLFINLIINQTKISTSQLYFNEIIYLKNTLEELDIDLKIE